MKTITIFEHATWPDSSNKDQKEMAQEFSENLKGPDDQILKFLQDEHIIKFDKIENQGIRITANHLIGVVNFSKFQLQIITKIYKA